MPFVNAELTRCPLGDEVFHHAMRATFFSQTTVALRDALKSAAEVDRNTVWPTHRIRCFLLSQQNVAPLAASR